MQMESFRRFTTEKLEVGSTAAAAAAFQLVVAKMPMFALVYARETPCVCVQLYTPVQRARMHAMRWCGDGSTGPDRPC